MIDRMSRRLTSAISALKIDKRRFWPICRDYKENAIVERRYVLSAGNNLIAFGVMIET